MRVLLTGADGKLAAVVRPILRAEGFDVINWGETIDLNSDKQVNAATLRLTDKVDALVHLAGGFVPGNWPEQKELMLRKNLETFVTVLNNLLRENKLGEYPALVGIGAVFTATPLEMHRARAYFDSKARLCNLLHTLNGRYQYATCIEPAWPIDSDERREDIAFRILDAVTVPVRLNTLDEQADEESKQVPSLG